MNGVCDIMLLPERMADFYYKVAHLMEGIRLACIFLLLIVLYWISKPLAVLVALIEISYCIRT